MISDDILTIWELKNYTRYFCEEREWDVFHTPKDLAYRIHEEAVEILKCCESPTEVEMELGDITFNVLRFAGKYNISLASVLKDLMETGQDKADGKATVSELKSIVAESCNAEYWLGATHHAAESIKEQSEIFMNYFDKMTHEESRTLLGSEHIKEEVSVYLTGIFIGILGLASISEIDLSAAFYDKMEKNAKKYPVEKAKGSGKKYTEWG